MANAIASDDARKRATSNRRRINANTQKSVFNTVTVKVALSRIFPASMGNDQLRTKGRKFLHTKHVYVWNAVHNDVTVHGLAV